MQLATPQNESKPKPTSVLGRAASGRIETPYRVLVYGPEKVGKSTFANGAPDPIFFDTEEGTNELDIKTRVPILIWDNFIRGLDELLETKTSYRTIVTDSVTSVERMAAYDVCQKAGKKALNEFAHGRGYTSVYAMWDQAMLRFERLFREQHMNIVFVAHSAIESFKNPEGDDFDRYTIDLSKHVRSVLKKWTNAILFANFEALVDVDKDTKQAKGVGGNVRVMQTQHRNAYDAGNRYNLPERIEFSWQSFDYAAKNGQEKVRRLLTEINEMSGFTSA